VATIIPTTDSAQPPLSAGKRRFLQRVEVLLPPECLCWRECPTAERPPDFILLDPNQGLLVLTQEESTLREIVAQNASTTRASGFRSSATLIQSLQRARQCLNAFLPSLQGDLVLSRPVPKSLGRELNFPHGFGVVLSNITRAEFEQANLGEVFPWQRVLCKDEMTNAVSAEAFEKQLWNMCVGRLLHPLSDVEVDRVRWHLFPEVRMEHVRPIATVVSKRAKPDATASLPVMDLEDERIGRGMSAGHYVIHGPAGAGKTQMLKFRCELLYHTLARPILVVTSNASLAAKLQEVFTERGLIERVTVRHFHGWCSDQLSAYNLSPPENANAFPGRLVRAVEKALEDGQIPRAQYGAVLIDEGHDFEPEWLRMLVSVLDPATNSLLLLYDDAQSIHGAKSTRELNLAKVGIDAGGERSIFLPANRRNTVQILRYAYEFAKEAFESVVDGADNMPLVIPRSKGRQGPIPTLAQLHSVEGEARHIAAQLWILQKRGYAWNDMAVIYPTRDIGAGIFQQLRAKGIPVEWLEEHQTVEFDPAENSVKVMTMHTSKGLQFRVVAIPGVGFMPNSPDEFMEDAKLLYIGMTRATDQLLLTAHQPSDFAKRLIAVAATAFPDSQRPEAPVKIVNWEKRA
jgi:hypothetical protein